MHQAGEKINPFYKHLQGDGRLDKWCGKQVMHKLHIAAVLDKDTLPKTREKYFVDIYVQMAMKIHSSDFEKSVFCIPVCKKEP